MIIADLILTAASVGFVGADIRQAVKLFKNSEYDVNGFSHWHFRLKIFSLILVVFAYFILGVFLALSVAITQLIVNMYIYKRIGGFKWKRKN